MKRSAMQFGIVLLMGLAGPVTAEVQSTQTVQADSPTTNPAHPRPHLPHFATTGTATVIASNLPLARVIGQASDQSKVPIAIKGTAADAKVSIITPKPIPIDDFLHQLVASSPDLVLKDTSIEGAGVEGKSYEIWRQKEYEKASIMVKTYPVKSARARDLERFVKMALKHGTEDVLADDRLNKLVVNALPESHEEVSRLLGELDREMPTRIFTIQHRNPKDMTYKLINFFPIAQDQVTYDDASGQVAVRASIDILVRVEQLVKTFDVPPAKETGSSSTAVRSRR